MEVEKFEFLKAIFKVVEASNEEIFKICVRFDLNLHLAPKKFENRKWFLPAYLPMCRVGGLICPQFDNVGVLP